MFKILTNEELKEMLFNLKPENQIIAEKENGGLFKITKIPTLPNIGNFISKTNITGITYIPVFV